MNPLIFIPEERLEQGSEPWLQRRKIVGTSTQSPCVMGEPLPYKDSVKTWLQLHSERAFGSTFQGNLDSERGTRLEPYARELFNEQMKGKVEEMVPIWCERSLQDGAFADTEFSDSSILHWTDPDSPLPPIFGPTIASSYDGYSRNGDFHAWLEIKCPRDKRSKVWKSIKAGRLPDDYYWQVCHQRATFGDHDAFGYFMAYLDDKNYLIMAIDDDERVKSGQFDRDVARVSVEWIKFLGGEPQPGDMSMNEEWAKFEADLIKNRNERMAIEVTAKPFGDAEERAKGKLKDMIKDNIDVPGLPRIYGRQVNFSNRASRSFDMDAFKAANPDFDFGPYETVEVRVDMDAFKAANPDVDLSAFEVAETNIDTAKLIIDQPEFVSTKDSWTVQVQE